MGSSEEPEGWRELFVVLDRLPFLQGLRHDLARLRRLVARRRPPRLAALGSPESARGWLPEALLGMTGGRSQGPEAAEGRWVTLEEEGRLLEWAEVAAGPEASAQARALASLQRPDLLLLTVTAAEVEAGLGHHLDALQSALGVFQDQDARPPPVLAVLSASVDPPAASGPVRELLARQLREASLRARVHLVAEGPSGLVGGAEPSGLAALASAIVDALPEPARLEGARALPGATAARRRVATAVVHSCSTLAVTVAVTPFPLSDVAILAPLQGLMVTTVAYVSGRPWHRKTALEWLTSLGLVGAAGLSMRWGAQQLVKVLPAAGSVVSAGIAGAGTLALGRSAARYFLGEDLEA